MLPFGAADIARRPAPRGVAAGLLASALGRPVRFVSPRAVSVRLMPAGAFSGGASVSVPAQAAPGPSRRSRSIEKAEAPPPPSSRAVLLPAKEKKPQPPALSSRPTQTPRADAKSQPAGDARGTAAGPTINASGSGVGIGGARLDQEDFNTPTTSSA